MNGYENKAAALEAVLFAAGEPIEEVRLCSALNMEMWELTDAALALSERLAGEESGIELTYNGGKYSLVTKSLFADEICTVLETRKPAALSTAAMETLAVVAYRQPVTKLYVEQVRGVECGYSLNSLLDKGLIRVAGRLEAPGRPLTYETTDFFLRVFGMRGIGDLPPMEEAEKKPEA